MRDYYKILLVGASGKGKTYCAKTLDPNTTGFINVECQPLSFKNNFKYHSKTPDYREAYRKLIEYAKDPNIKVIFFDSFSAYMDSVLKEAKATKKGFDVWSFYNDEIAKFHELLNLIEKEVIVTAHYEILDIEGGGEKRAKVHGKQNEGLIERFYTVVMFADSKYADDGSVEYFLRLNGEGISAKCPPDIFESNKIENDGQMIINKIVKFAE